MRAVLYRARAQIRRRVRTLVALAILVGVAGSFVLAAFAGARRTATAYDRFLAVYPGADVLLPNPAFGPEFGARVHRPEDVAAMEEVASTGVGRAAMSSWGAGFAAADERFGFDTPRWKLLAGRPYDPARADEAVALHTLAEREGLRVGDVITYPGPAPPEAPPECANIADEHQVQVRIVGIAVLAGPFFSSLTEHPWTLLLSPAMHDRLPELVRATGCEVLAFPPTNGMIWVRTVDGEVDAFLAALDRQGGGGFVISELQRTYDDRSRDSIRLQATALAILGVAVALAAILILSQSFVRQIHLESDDHATLSALGSTKGQLVSGAIAPVGLAAVAGAMLAILGALALSPLTPLGAGRMAEPSPGVRFDALVLGGGALAIALGSLVVAIPSAWFSSRNGRARLERRERPTLASRAAGAGFPTPMVAGLRMALEPGRGRGAVPVRTTITGVALGLGMLAATTTFGASANHLIETPPAYGLTVDAWIHNDPMGYPFGKHLDAVHANPDVVGAALGTPGGAVQLDGRSVEVIDFEVIKGDVHPRMLEGRVPSGRNEVMLGARTASRLGKGVGDEVIVAVQAEDGTEGVEQAMEIVGIGAIPPLERAGLGEGAIVTPATTAALYGGGSLDNGLFVDIREGADADGVLAALKRSMGNEDLQHFDFPPPADVVDFGRVRNLPSILAVVLAVVAAGALAHLLVTAVRRRRRDLAVLKTIGFVRRQARAAVAWQAVTTVVIGAFIGLPAGVVLGRWAWSLLVGRLGLVPEPVVPLIAIAVSLPAALAFANLIAALPARDAARTRPALVLREE